MTRITGQQAREMLDGIIPGPWVAYHDVDARGDDPVSTIESHHHYDSPLAVVDGDGVSTPENARLIAYAPALAETVAWLYGREPDAEAVDGTERHWRDQTILTSRGAGALAMFKGNFIGHGDEMTPDEAVDLARALLAAAEEARP